MSLSTRIAAVALAGATMIATAVLTAAPADAATPVYYELVGLGSNKCLDVRSEDGGGVGSRVQLWQCFGSANQRWALYPVGRTSTGPDLLPDHQPVAGAPVHAGAG